MKTILKRKKLGKTDYKKRFGLLKSGKARIAIRKTNKYIIIQYIKSKESRDSVVMGITSKELLKYGWPEKIKGSLKSIPAAYLTGILAGKRIIKMDKNADAIIDLGLARNVSGSRLYASLKGLIDAGLNINCEEKIFPKDERIKGKHLRQDFSKTFEDIKSKITKE